MINILYRVGRSTEDVSEKRHRYLQGHHGVVIKLLTDHSGEIRQRGNVFFVVSKLEGTHLLRWLDNSLVKGQAIRFVR